MKKIIAIAALVVIAAGLAAFVAPPSSAAPAGAVRLEAPTRHVEHVRVTYVHKSERDPKWVEFNTGSLWAVRACRYEDSNNCYWSAKKRGNDKGRSFVRLAGKTYYTKGL